jgi:hypothetical protein
MFNTASDIRFCDESSDEDIVETEFEDSNDDLGNISVNNSTQHTDCHR